MTVSLLKIAIYYTLHILRLYDYNPLRLEMENIRAKREAEKLKIIYFANTDWYLYNFRLELGKSLLSKGWEVVFMSPEGDYSNKFELEGIRYIPINFSRKGINPISEYLTIRKIRDIYQKEKPNIVHHFTVKCDIYGSLAAKKVGNIGIINSITGLGYVFLSQSLKAKIIRKITVSLYKKALENTQVIFENPDDEELFSAMDLVTKGNCHIILGTGVNVDYYNPVPPPDSVPLTILPARMLFDKGVVEFVEAAEIIKKKGIPSRFALVGKNDEGNPSSISYDQLTKWQKEGNVEWWGWQDDILTVFSICDIVCLPSYREGLPRVLIEAAACSRPIITTNVPGCKEVVTDGVNGILVPEKQAIALAEAMEKLILNRDMRIEMGKAGREKAIQRFSIEKVNQETYSIYQWAHTNDGVS